MQAGIFVDAEAPASDVLAELELQRARCEQLAAQAQELAQLAAQLEGPAEEGTSRVPWELGDAEAALQVR